LQPEDAPVAELDGRADNALDLGSLIMAVDESLSVRVEADSGGRITELYVDHDGSTMQLGVFAADPGHAIWSGVRDEIRASLFEDGEAARPVTSEFGTDLLTQALLDQGPVSLRFIGIDGPGWMVRGVIQGEAATDPQRAEPFLACLRQLRVVRGDRPIPERTRLPLWLPVDLRNQVAGQPAEAEDDDAGTPD
jgi:hypothetical protein